MTKKQSEFESCTAISASVIIPTYRRFSCVLNTIENMLGQTRNDMEIIIADQNGWWPDEYMDRLRHLTSDRRVRLLEVERLGVVNARHQAVEESRGEILIFLDDDIVVKDDHFIDRHLRNYEDETIDAVLGREIVRTEMESLSDAQSPIARE